MRMPWRRSEREEREASGRIGVVQAQLLIVITVVALQLWLLTVALDEFLGGHPESVLSLTILSGLGCLLSLAILAVRRRH